MPKRRHEKLPPFYERFTQLSERVGFETDRELAVAMGKDASQISRWSNQRTLPNTGHLIFLADFFSTMLDIDLTIDQLIGREDFPWEDERPARPKRRGPRGPVEGPVGEIDEELAGNGRSRRSRKRGSAAGA